MINIIEIQQRMEQGFTKPWLCVGDDGHMYVVKRLNATFKGCVYEWLAGNLGRVFGINIPNVELVYIDDYLIEFDSELEMELGSGVAFASRFYNDLNEISYSELIKSDKSKLIDLYIFDYWIKNDDRTLTQTGGNPNLYQSLMSKELVVFDHNLAFDANFDLNGFKDTHVSSFLLKGQSDWLEEPIEKSVYQLKLESAFNNIDKFINYLPDDWLVGIENPASELDRLKVILSDFKHDEFWEAIK